jgi:hypothetical protein
MTAAGLATQLFLATFFHASQKEDQGLIPIPKLKVMMEYIGNRPSLSAVSGII